MFMFIFVFIFILFLLERCGFKIEERNGRRRGRALEKEGLWMRMTKRIETTLEATRGLQEAREWPLAPDIPSMRWRGRGIRDTHTRSLRVTPTPGCHKECHIPGPPSRPPTWRHPLRSWRRQMWQDVTTLTMPVCRLITPAQDTDLMSPAALRIWWPTIISISWETWWRVGAGTMCSATPTLATPTGRVPGAVWRKHFLHITRVRGTTRPRRNHRSVFSVVLRLLIKCSNVCSFVKRMLNVLSTIYWRTIKMELMIDQEISLNNLIYVIASLLLKS